MTSSPSQYHDITGKLRAAGCVFAEDEATLLLAQANDETKLNDMIDKRVTGVPIEHILGWAEFYGQRIIVGPGVFVPRRRSEYLVEQAAKLVRHGATVVDLCCGSGALGVALSHHDSSISLYAADIESTAIRYARQNVAPIGGRVFEGDLFAALPPELAGTVDLLLVNAPYIPTDEIRLQPSEARLYEPRITLDGGADGLDVQRRIAAEATTWLAPQGRLIIETGGDQAHATVEIMKRGGLSAKIIQNRDLDLTVVVAQKT